MVIFFILILILFDKIFNINKLLLYIIYYYIIAIIIIFFYYYIYIYNIFR